MLPPLAGDLDHVVVGEDPAVRAEDDARAGARALGAGHLDLHDRREHLRGDRLDRAVRGSVGGIGDGRLVAAFVAVAAGSSCVASQSAAPPTPAPPPTSSERRDHPGREGRPARARRWTGLDRRGRGRRPGGVAAGAVRERWASGSWSTIPGLAVRILNPCWGVHEGSGRGRRRTPHCRRSSRVTTVTWVTPRSYRELSCAQSPLVVRCCACSPRSWPSPPSPSRAGVEPASADHTAAPTSVTLVGTIQSELGCAADWSPDCAATHLAPAGRRRVVGDVRWCRPAATSSRWRSTTPGTSRTAPRAAATCRSCWRAGPDRLHLRPRHPPGRRPARRPRRDRGDRRRPRAGGRQPAGAAHPRALLLRDGRPVRQRRPDQRPGRHRRRTGWRTGSTRPTRASSTAVTSPG